MLLSELIKKIKSKKQLQNLDDFIIEQKIISHLKKNSLHLQDLNKKQLTNLLKIIRKQLHEQYGVFQLDLKKRKIYFEQLKNCLKNNSINSPNSIFWHNKILFTHSSTKERLEIYSILYKKLFRLTLKPNSILDISAGLNPFSFPYMQLKNVKYTATELNLIDCEFIQSYFNLIKINGKVLQLDLLEIKNLPKTDLTFIFKTFHTLEKNSFKLAESVLKKLNSKYVIVSFPIKTISNKKMNFPYYPGFERLLKRLNFKYKKLLLKNELFFVIKK